jgi:hypothetical protein
VREQSYRELMRSFFLYLFVVTNILRN